MAGLHDLDLVGVVEAVEDREVALAGDGEDAANLLRAQALDQQRPAMPRSVRLVYLRLRSAGRHSS